MKKFLKIIGMIAVFMGVYLIFQFIYMIGVSIIGGVMLVIKDPGFYEADNVEEILLQIVSNQILIAMIVSAILSFGVYYLICKARKENIFRVCEFNKLSNKRLLLLLPTGTTLYFANIFILLLLSKIRLMENAFSDHGELMNSLMDGPFIITFLSVGIVVPFIEEIIFRGLIFNELKKSLSIKWTILIQAILFGLFHMQVIQGIYATLIGILLGLIYLWFKSIWAPVIIHAIVNSISVFLSRIPSQRLFGGYEVLILGASIIGCLVSFRYIYK